MNYIAEAENARQEFINAQNEAKDYAGSKPLRILKKDVEFIKFTRKIIVAKKLWYDYNAAAIIQAREEKVKAILN